MGFQKKSLDVGGWGELYPNVFWDFLKVFTFAKPLSGCVEQTMLIINECHYWEPWFQFSSKP